METYMMFLLAAVLTVISVGFSLLLFGIFWDMWTSK